MKTAVPWRKLSLAAVWLLLSLLTAAAARASETCAGSALEQARERYMAEEREGRHDAAARQLLPLLERCGPRLTPQQQAHLRNDIAWSWFQGGRRDACLVMLAPVLGPAFDERVGRRVAEAPAEKAEWDSIRFTARHHHTLCAAPPPASPPGAAASSGEPASAPVTRRAAVPGG